MKSLELFSFLPILLLSFDDFADCLLIRGGKNVKNLEHRMGTVPRVCLEPPFDLPACDFADENGDRTPAKTLRPLNSMASNGFDDVEESETVADAGTTHGPKTIIYKFEGCVPHKFPFALPLCKTQDWHGKDVEVIRLSPFEPIGPLAQRTEGLSASILTKGNANQGQRFPQESPIRMAALVGNRVRDTDSDATRISPTTRIADVSRKHVEIGRHVADEALFTEKFQRFPYSEALLSHSKELGLPKPENRFSRATMISNDTSRVTPDNIYVPWLFPHAKTVPLEMAKLELSGSSFEQDHKSGLPFWREFVYEKKFVHHPWKHAGLRKNKKASQIPATGYD